MKSPVSLKARALQWLAQREHSRLELRRKLVAYAARQQALAGRVAAGTAAPVANTFTRRPEPSAADEAGVDALLDWLTAQQHLSDARFIEGRVRSRAARLGNLRIGQELAQHGLELSAGDRQALKDSEFARAQRVWQRKFGAPAVSAADRARQQRFLAARGFSADVIRRVLRGDGD